MQRPVTGASLSAVLALVLVGVALVPAAVRTPSVGALNLVPLVNAEVGDRPDLVTVIAGHPFFARGSRFQPKETITFAVTFPLYRGASPVESAAAVTETKSVVTNDQGTSIGILMSVPKDAKQGLATLLVIGKTSRRQARALVRVVYQPWVRSDPSPVPAGQSLQITGGGFAPSSHLHLSVTVPHPAQAGKSLVRDATTNDDGAFRTSMAVPLSTPAGTYSVTAIDLTHGFHAAGPLQVVHHPILVLQPNPVIPGHSVTIHGEGFEAGVTMRLYARFPLSTGDSQTVTMPVQTTSRGAVSARLLVPSTAVAGTVRVTVRGPKAAVSGTLRVK